VAERFPSAAGRRFGIVIESMGAPAAELLVEWALQPGAAGASRAFASALARPLPREGAPMQALELSAGSQVVPLRTAAAPAAALTAVPTPGAAAYNVRLATDASPDLTDLDSLIHSTTSAWPTSREKVWALFYWSHRLKRQTAPMMLHGFEVTDPIRNFLDYGFTMCSTISGINQVLYDALGLPHQYWDICNHTVSTVQYEGKFRMIDSSMSNLVTTDDGVSLASLEEAAADYARLVRERSLYATSPNGFLTGSDALRNLPDFTTPTGSTLKGFASNFCPGGLKFQDYYYNWDAGHRYVLNLREDESYTRYYRRLGTTADYWIPSEKIASPNPASTTQIDSANTFGNRGNGVWSWAPRLTPAEWERAVHRAANIASVGSGLAPALPDLPAELVYKVQAGNAIASQKIDAQFSRPDPGATASIAVSINHGASWTEVGTIGAATGLVPLTVNLRSEVSAAYETLVRVQMRRNGGGPADGVVLTGLSITTLTQVNVHGLPKLNIGRNEIFLGLGESSDTMVLWPELRGDLWRTDAYDSSNIASQGVGVPRKYTAAAYPAILTQDAHLTYRMDAPRDITRLVYGGRLHNYRAGSYIDFLHSFDGGQSWIRSYRLSDVGKPYDVLHYETVTDIPPGTRTVLFKYLIHNTNGDSSRASGLYSVRMEVNHRPDISAPPPLEVTLRWKEIAADRTTVDRSHKQRVGEFPFRYVVNVGGSDHPVMESITLNVDGAGDGSPAGYSDGVDAGGQKYVYRKRTDGMNLAAQKPYTISRAPSGFGSSAGAANTTILTDGVVGAPGTGGIAYWWGQCWTSGQNVDLLVDLGAPQAVGAFRAHLFGYASWDALKGQVQDRVEVSSSVDGVDFVSHGLLDTSLWRKDIPINHLLPDDGKATGWNFERTVPAAVTARYVRYRITPKRNLCVSELQVLDRVVYEPFDIRIAPPTWLEPPPGPVNVAPTIALTSPGAGAYFAAPATVLVSADAQDADGGIQLVEFFAGGMPIGTATAAPYTFTWADVPAGEYALTARATDTSGAETTSDPIALVVDPAPPASDIPPQVALTSPATGLTLTAPATATLTADATDPDDGVARVQFFANGVLLGQATTAPYSLTWSDIPAGQYSLTARATDPAGAATTSNAVLLTVDAPPPPPVAPAIDEIVIHAAPAAQIVCGWVVTADSTAASGARLQNPNANAPKVSSPLAAPTQAFDLTFQAEAGKGYRLWLRGKALSNSYSNDSVFVQFAGSVDAAGVPTWRIDSTDGSTVILEDCSGCGLSGWGWADNGYGTNVLGPLVYFAATGPQRLRVQMREDGLGIDQVVLSAVRYLQTPPGAAKNDTTILEATPIVVGPPSNAAPSVSLTAPAEGPPPVAPATITLRAAASDPDGTNTAVEF
jgi:hypothetical protein